MLGKEENVSETGGNKVKKIKTNFLAFSVFYFFYSIKLF